MNLAEVVHESASLLFADILSFDEDKSWALTLKLDHDRTQGVWITRAELGKHTVWVQVESRSGSAEGLDSAELLRRAAGLSFARPVVLPDGGLSVRGYLPLAGLDYRHLAAVVVEVGQLADDLEEELHHQDML
ncbi:MAG: hypothetical protein JXX28_15745 [Deltaproteobacteria bacterium]|nr:hypothetical protein [Deltaproteobacteria bacterium]